MGGVPLAAPVGQPFGSRSLCCTTYRTKELLFERNKFTRKRRSRSKIYSFTNRMRSSNLSYIGGDKPTKTFCRPFRIHIIFHFSIFLTRLAKVSGTMLLISPCDINCFYFIILTATFYLSLEFL